MREQFSSMSGSSSTIRIRGALIWLVEMIAENRL
jgi:hypothetical protein